jgi:hypothetical protein
LREEKMPQELSDLANEFRLASARIVAMVKNGGAVVEHADLTVHIGHRETSQSERNLEPRCSYLEPFCDLYVADCPESQVAQMIEADLVVEGTHPNGLRLEMRGPGWIGYDNNGNVETSFEPVPAILIEDDETAQAIVELRQGRSTALDGTPPKLSEQYARAMIGRSLGEDAEA